MIVARHEVPGVLALTEVHVGKSSPRRGWRTQPFDAPTLAQGEPRVSTLGTDHRGRRALKGRQIERTNKAEVGSNCTSSLRPADAGATAGTPEQKLFAHRRASH
jgi:hypothetical protein